MIRHMSSIDTSTPPPVHVAIIMDGNGRWAKGRGWARLKGHEAGAESVRAALDAAQTHGIKYLTLYAFSIENWKRPEDEVHGLMKLLMRFLKRYKKDLHEKKIRLRIMGRKSDLPEDVRMALTTLEDETAQYADYTLIIALSYGGRTEIANAARTLAERIKAGTLAPEAIDEDALAGAMYLPDVPDPDLIIRTSGEERLSNFLLWQCAYSEFYFTPTLWPDFREKEFAEALEVYKGRVRRYGGI